MRKILATVFGLAVLATATPAGAANSNPHPGWQHNPRNPHYVKVVTPVFHPIFPGADPVPTPVYKPPFGGPMCTWVIGAAIGDVPHCVPNS